MKLAADTTKLSASEINYLIDSAYNSGKWNLPKGFIYNDGPSDLEKYITANFQVMRPIETSAAFGSIGSFTVTYSARYDYVFYPENSTGATATRRVGLYILDKKTGSQAWQGFITMTLATATAHTAKDFKVEYSKISATASASGTAVTLSAGAPVTNRVAVGARIGWGATSAAVTTWYRISAITSDVAVTLATTAGTIGSGQCWIEEFRPIYGATNATGTNGGIHIGKGITPEDFTNGGTTIALAVSTDNVKAMYWIKDASTQTNIVLAGLAVDFDNGTTTNLDCYAVDLVSAGNYKFYKYNLRAALTVATGASVNAFVLATGNNTFTGSGVSGFNCCIANTNHGAGSGVNSLYMVTTSRIYRTPLTAITNASTTVLTAGDNIVETPPGGTSTMALIGAFNTIEYLKSIDRFIFSELASSQNGYIGLSRYLATGVAFDRKFGAVANINNQSAKDSNHPSIFNINLVAAQTYQFHDTGDGLYISKSAASAAANQIYFLPHNLDWEFSGANYRLISPKILTPNAKKYYKALSQAQTFIGSIGLGKVTEDYRMYVRTTNIDSDATSGWALVNDLMDISSYAGAASIQFAFEFRIFGEYCIPPRIYGGGVTYEDTSTLSNYHFSQGKSDATNKRFAFRFVTAFGGSVPALSIQLYDGVSGGSLLTDNTTSPTGTWERSTDGTAWSAWTNADKANDTTYVRYTPASLADNITVRPVLTLL